MNRATLVCLGVLLVAAAASRGSAQMKSTVVPSGAHYPKIPTTTTVTSVSPNPFKTKTTVSYTLKTAGHLTVTVVDAKANEIATLLDQHVAAGQHDLEIHSDRFTASGTYYCKLTWENEPPVTVNLSFQK
jgi:hypothetical protein